MAQTLKEESCPYCKSKDNVKVFINQYGKETKKCMTPDCDFNKQLNKIFDDNINSDYKALDDRHISKETCEKLDYKIGIYANQPAHIYNYYDMTGVITDTKVRILPKDFIWPKKKSNNTSMFGLYQAQDFTKPLILTEGEIDCLSFYEIGLQAASLHSGAESIEKCITQDIERINKYSEIWLCLDNDAPGKKANQKALELLSHKLVKCIDLRKYKDANEALSTDKDEFIQIASNPLEIIPDGIIFGKDLSIASLKISPPKGYDLPWTVLNDYIKGLQKGMLYLLGAGSSIGKSSVLRELVYYLRTTHKNLKIANLFLEETQEVSPLAYIAIDNNVPIGKLLLDRNCILEENFSKSFNSLLNTENLMFTTAQYDLNSQKLIKTIEYLAKIKKYDIIILDHISLVISGTSLSKAGERRDIDELMHNLSSLVKKLGVIVIAACHLSNPDKGKNWDEGREVGLYDLKGSSGLAQKPDVVIGIERNMRSEFECDKVKFRVLKNRWFSKLGEADTLYYFERTGRLLTQN